MSAPELRGRAATGWTGERLRGAPIRLVLLLVGVEALAVILSGSAFATEPLHARSVGRAALLLALSLVFEEISRQVGRMRLIISSGPKPDMTSVWTFAAALVLFPGQAAVVAAAISGQIWLTRQRSAGQLAYRKVYTAATIVLACLSASALLHNSHLPSGSLAPGLRFAAALVLALIAYTLVNRLLISLALLSSGAPLTRDALLGGWEDNALEVATLCLGYFTALSVVYVPWLAPLMLAPVLLLQRGALVKELEHVASTDDKTQLLTALAWQQRSQRLLLQAAHDNTVATILLLDLDHFKRLNDSHGHLAGDVALYRVAEQLKRELRASDPVGRFGGEEFVVMLPGLDVPAALAVAERIRARIAAIPITALGVALPTQHSGEALLSASIGLAHYPEHGTELPDLLHAADTALYVAKRAGRDRIAVAGTPGTQDGLHVQG